MATTPKVAKRLSKGFLAMRMQLLRGLLSIWLSIFAAIGARKIRNTFVYAYLVDFHGKQFVSNL